MKILILTENGYEWKKVDTIDRNGRLVVGNNIISDSSILKFKGTDIRKKYSRCYNCGALVKKGDEEKHFLKMESKEINCLTCSCMRIRDVKTIKKTQKLNEDGTTIKTTYSEEGVPYCSNSYGTPRFSLKEAQSLESKLCKKYTCRRRGYISYTSVFDSFPKLNGRAIPTINKLYKSKFEFERLSDEYGYVFILNNTKVFLNKYGILDCFRNSRNTYNFIYSKEYDKFFVIRNRTFMEVSEEDLNKRFKFGKRDIKAIKQLYN